MTEIDYLMLQLDIKRSLLKMYNDEYGERSPESDKLQIQIGNLYSFIQKKRRL